MSQTFNVFYIVSLASFEDIQTKETPLHKECFHSSFKPNYNSMTQEQILERIEQHCKETPNECMHSLSIMVESNPMNWKENCKLEDTVIDFLKQTFSDYTVSLRSFIAKNSNISFTKFLITRNA